MEVKVESSKLVKPLYEGNNIPTNTYIPLSPFDTVTHDLHVAIIYAYRPPTPSTAVIESGLRKALSVYPEWAGRLTNDGAIHLNDNGVKFVEASVDRALDNAVIFCPSTALLSLHPPLEGVAELVQVQVTRFACGSMVVGFTAHHHVADGQATSDFLITWGKACRGVEITYLPFRDRTVFVPRNPPRFDYDHTGREYVSRNLKKEFSFINKTVDNIVMHKVHYTAEFLSELKTRASAMNEMTEKPFSTFETLMAHLWRTITKARGLGDHETTQIRISVNGRYRMNPNIPNYFGNLVLWAFPRAKVSDLMSNSITYATKVLHDAVTNVNDEYFKSFIDFANHKIKEEDLVSKLLADKDKLVLWPDLEVNSWLRFPFYELNFGSGSPYVFMPSFLPIEGLIYLLPYVTVDRSIDVIVSLFGENLNTFKDICYSME